MIHSFDVEEAKKLGVVEATILYNLKFWIAHNKANDKHFYNDRTWTYNSVKAFAILFPYLSEKQIRRAIEKLEEMQVIISGNYNTSSYDRSKWYALKDECISTDGQIHLPEKSNGFDQEGKTVNTDINTDSKQDKNNTQQAASAKAPKFDAIEFFKDYSVNSQVLTDWLKIRKGKRLVSTETAFNGFIAEVQKTGMNVNDAIELCCVRGWGGLDAKWLEPKAQAFSPAKKFDPSEYINTYHLPKAIK
jgi:hypothetical protein